MTHLTLTGYYAGTPICGAKKNAEDQYLHATYAPIEKLAANTLSNFSPLCPDCKAEWDGRL